MLKCTNFATPKELKEKLAFLKSVAQAFEAGDFLSILLRFWGLFLIKKAHFLIKNNLIKKKTCILATFGIHKSFNLQISGQILLKNPPQNPRQKFVVNLRAQILIPYVNKHLCHLASSLSAIFYTKLIKTIGQTLKIFKNTYCAAK